MASPIDGIGPQRQVQAVLLNRAKGGEDDHTPIESRHLFPGEVPENHVANVSA